MANITIRFVKNYYNRQHMNIKIKCIDNIVFEK